MKRISGVVVASKPISLTKAAKILPKFASANNSASPAFAAYLNRASNSIDELVQLLEELRGLNHKRKIRKRRYASQIQRENYKRENLEMTADNAECK